jgi:AraC-like DNA-binding protein
VTLEMVARQVGINRTKLALGFKQVFGVTVGEYLREHRLDLAREALEQQTRSVGEVAAMAGYCDAGSFTKAFRARYGSLPSLIKTESSSPCLRVVKN